MGPNDMGLLKLEPFNMGPFDIGAFVQYGPSRQLLETVNFAFMKIFDFLVKIAVFRASLLFLGDSRHALRS